LGNSNCNTLLEFIEKPDSTKAEILVQEQNIFWNAGIFFFSDAIMRTEFLAHSAGIFNDVARAIGQTWDLGKRFGIYLKKTANKMWLKAKRTIQIHKDATFSLMALLWAFVT